MLIHRFPADPFHTMDMLFDAMRPSVRRTVRPRSPATKVTLDETDEHFELRAELPGLAPEALELSAGDGWIELEAKREVEIPEGYKALHRERSPLTFSRRIELPKRVDADKIEATLHDGVLTVTMPKQAAVTPRQIAIKAA